MGILDNLLMKVRTVNDGLQGGELIRNVVVRHDADILELQKQQLFAGKASNGEDIRPYYSEDLKPLGYFHSVESARRYADWKQSGVRYPYSANRNPDAPNLYINGKFHSELGVQFNPDTVAVIGETAYAAGIVAKYGLQTFGLMASNWMEIFKNRGALNELIDELKRNLYGN